MAGQSPCSVVRVVGPVVHGVECYEAWREDRHCPHEQTSATGQNTSIKRPAQKGF